jgi:hypothetical protein
VDLDDSFFKGKFISNKYYLDFLKNNMLLNRRDQISFKDSFINTIKIKLAENNNPYSRILYNYNDFLEVNRWVKKSQGSNTPLRIIKFPISNKTNFDFNNDVINLFKFRFSDNENTVKHKPVPHSTFLTMKQKRYKRRKNIPARVKYFKDAKGNNTKKVR